MKINIVKLGIEMSKRNMNFNQLSAISGVSRVTLSYINNGKTCGARTLYKIANALDIKVEELIDNNNNLK